MNEWKLVLTPEELTTLCQLAGQQRKSLLLGIFGDSLDFITWTTPAVSSVLTEHNKVIRLNHDKLPLSSAVEQETVRKKDVNVVDKAWELAHEIMAKIAPASSKDFDHLNTIAHLITDAFLEEKEPSDENAQFKIEELSESSPKGPIPRWIEERMRAEMSAMNDRWTRLHKVLGTLPDDNWDTAPFAYIEQLKKNLNVDELVKRFLAWPLPNSVCSDPCVMDVNYPGRCGTNLLTADEARQMIEHLCLSENGVSSSATSVSSPNSSPSPVTGIEEEKWITNCELIHRRNPYWIGERGEYLFGSLNKRHADMIVKEHNASLERILEKTKTK